ncbi:hypothetical protein Dimus_016502 [Dionaea muscipula]
MRKPFEFLNAWAVHPLFLGIVRRVGTFQRVVARCSECGESKRLQPLLKKPHHRDFSGLPAGIDEAKKQLDGLRDRLRFNYSEDNKKRMRASCEKLRVLLGKGGMFPRQMAKEERSQAVQLGKDFTREDVTKALEEIADDKEPGVDGFTATFFKKSWVVIGDDVCKVVLDFFAKKKMLTRGEFSRFAYGSKRAKCLMCE